MDINQKWSFSAGIMVFILAVVLYCCYASANVLRISILVGLKQDRISTRPRWDGDCSRIVSITVR